MSRTKQYDRAELLDRAVELFRRQGYNGTSTAELVAELGVNRKSMYSEFGSKQGLFEAALEHYDDQHLTRVLRRLETPDAGLEAIGRALRGYATASEGWFNGRGCLLANTAVERAAVDPASGRHVAAYLERLRRAFNGALENGRRDGDIDPGAVLDQLAAYFTTALVGVAACIRAEAPAEQVRAACDVTTSVLELHRPSLPA